MYLLGPAIDAGTSLFSAPTFIRAVPLSNYDLVYSKLAGKGDSQLQRWSSLIGIVTAIVGNILISFALNIQRYAHIRLHEERAERRESSKSNGKRSPSGYGTIEGNGQNVEENLESSFSSQSSGCSDVDHKREPTYLQSPYWWGGIILMMIGETGNFLAYGFAPASIVSPLGVVALISNCVIAPIMLKERFRLRDLWGVVVAVGGAVTVVLSAKQQEKKLGPHEIWGAITHLEFEIYMAITISMIGVLMWASPRYGNRTILIDLGLVGLFGGYTALSTKGVASMLSSTLWRALTTPVTYALLAVLVGTAIMQVRYVNNALQRFDSTQVIPVQFVMFTLSVIIGSAILYRDFEKTTAENVVKFVGGCLLTFSGVYLITSGRPSQDEDSDDDSEQEDEERIGIADQERNEVENRIQDESEIYNTARRRASLSHVNGADDEPRSRRVSKISFSESTRPQIPKWHSNNSYQPSIRLISAPDDEPSGNEESPLLSNPWKVTPEEVSQHARHPGMPQSSSHPVLPSEAQARLGSLRRPGTPRTLSQGELHTHSNLQQSPAPPQADLPMTPARHSISRMMPGPLLSPLSGGLSAIVADSLRRGVDVPNRSKSLKRPRLNLRGSISGFRPTSFPGDDEDELGTSPLRQSESLTQVPEPDVSKSLGSEENESLGRLTRARSLSTTLSDMFRGKKSKRSAGDEAGAPGPSEI